MPRAGREIEIRKQPSGFVRSLHGRPGFLLWRAHHIAALVTIWGAPPWANGDRPPNRLPGYGLGNFAYAASKRWPWVHLWTIWNEPNTLVFSNPVSPLLYTRRLLNPAYALLHRANRANRLLLPRHSRALPLRLPRPLLAWSLDRRRKGRSGNGSACRSPARKPTPCSPISARRQPESLT